MSLIVHLVTGTYIQGENTHDDFLGIFTNKHKITLAIKHYKKNLYKHEPSKRFLFAGTQEVKLDVEQKPCWYIKELKGT